MSATIRSGDIVPNETSNLQEVIARILSDSSLSQPEHQRRKGILRAIEEREREDGVYVAQSSPVRARQFMPFAALKGYHELAHERESVPEQKQLMTEERAAELSQDIARLSKGCSVSIVHYEGEHYINTCGVVSEIDEAFHRLYLGKKAISFDGILSLEILDTAASSLLKPV